MLQLIGSSPIMVGKSASNIIHTLLGLSQSVS
jgi:hypothetical protein